MTKNRIALAIIAGMLTSAPAGASEFFSPAYINQIDTGSFSRVSTMEIVKPILQLAESLPASRTRPDNLGLIWQDGDTNNASIVQDGTGNVGLIRQIGLHNTASIRQTGAGHQALVFQQGRGNVAIIRQR